MKVRGTLRVSQQSRHYKLYQFWKARAKHKNGPGYRENLCHYCRVVLFWGPLSWFVNATPTQHKWLTPGIGFVGVSGPLALMATFAFWPGPALRMLLTVVGGVVVAVLLLGLLAVIDDHQEGAKKVGVGLATIIFSPLILVAIVGMLIFATWPSVVGKGSQRPELRTTWRKFGRGVSWVFSREIYGMWWWSYPLIAAGLGALAYLCAIYPQVLFVTIMIGTVAAVGTVFFLVLADPLVAKVSEVKIQRKIARTQRAEVKREKNGDSFFKVAWGFVVAKKQRACPYIDLVD